MFSPGDANASGEANVLVSAHRGGSGGNILAENSIEVIESSIKLPVDYIEFDVRETFDHQFIAWHDSNIVIDGVKKPIKQLTLATIRKNYPEVCLVQEIIDAIEPSNKKVHLDLKIVSDKTEYHEGKSIELQVIVPIIEKLGSDRLIVTSGNDESVLVVRDWARRFAPDLLVGLSIGGQSEHSSFFWNTYRSIMELCNLGATIRIKQSDSNLVVARKDLAHQYLIKWAHKHKLPILVWTVDNAIELENFLDDKRVWMVTTNYPEKAIFIRDNLKQT